MTYYESADSVTISYARACKEVLDHHCSVKEFEEDMGRKDWYNARDVLDWLGY